MASAVAHGGAAAAIMYIDGAGEQQQLS